MRRRHGAVSVLSFWGSDSIEHMRRSVAAFSISALLLLCSASPVPAQSGGGTITPTLHGDSAHPARTKNWVDTKLYFGLGPADAPGQGISEAAWREFLDKEVTPRFPDGLSVLDVYGQWESKLQPNTVGHTERIRSKLLIIDYADTAANRAKIDAIRTAWKARSGEHSVLKVTERADVSF